MRKLIKLLLIGVCVATLFGCEAAMVPYTSDPAEKLEWSKVLLEDQDRPLPAERLIFEAMDIYKTNNDKNGLAEAYRRYGIFLKSYSVQKSGKYFQEHGFLDKSVTFNNRLDKSIEYFDKAKEQFNKTKSYDMLSNVYLQLAFVYAQKGENKLACKSLDSSLKNHAQFESANPGVKVHGAGSRSFNDVIADQKKRMQCM